MIKALPYAILMCCWLPLSGNGNLLYPVPPDTVTPAPPDTAWLPVTLAPTPSAGPLTLLLQPDTAFRHYSTTRLEWQLILNGLPAKKGITVPFPPPAGRPVSIHLPVRLRPGPQEAWLRVTVRLSPTRSQPRRLFTRLLPLRPWHADISITPTGELSFTDTLGIFTITSANTLIRFDKQTGWLLHYEAGHTLLMGDSAGLRPDVWPPPVQPHLQLFSTSTGAQLIIVRAEYTVPEAGCLLHLSYTIDAAGEMLVGQTMEPDTTRGTPPSGSSPRPPLTRFGMRWTLPQDFDSVIWYGGRPVPAITNLPVSPPREYTFDDARTLTLACPAKIGMQVLADSTLLQLTVFPDSTGHRSILGIDASLPAPAHPLPAGTMRLAFKVSPVAKPF